MLGYPPPCEDIAPKRQVSEMPKRTVIVNDKMQKRYRYERIAAVGRNFDPEFKPELCAMSANDGVRPRGGLAGGGQGDPRSGDKRTTYAQCEFFAF